MLENVNLKQKLSRKAYEKILPGLEHRLYDLENACWTQKIPSIIVLEGWDASGKGAAISALTRRLDPRGFKVATVQPPTDAEAKFPWLRRFWIKTPARGEMAIFHGSWYTQVWGARVERRVSKPAWRASFDDINDFERMLAEDGAAIVKCFLHIGKHEQKRRMKKLEKEPWEVWRVARSGRARHCRYDRHLADAEQMLEFTDAEYAPGTIVEATSRWWARKRVFDTVIAALERRLGRDAPPSGDPEETAKRGADLRAAMEALELAGKS